MLPAVVARPFLPALAGAGTGETPPGEVVEDERALVARAQSGDREAFHEIYRRYSGPVYRIAVLPLVRDRARAEDLLADTFVRALEHLPRFRWQGRGLLPWLVRIAKNLCLDQLRRGGRFGGWPEGFDELVPDPSDAGADGLLGRSELADLLAERIAVTMAGLNPRYRRVLELRLREGQGRAQAAEALGVSLGTLDVLLFRACKAFRRAYLARFGAKSEGEP